MEDSEATQLILETLLDMRIVVDQIPDAVVDDEETEEDASGTPQERRAELERRADLDRRLLEMIERYRELNAKKRAAGS